MHRSWISRRCGLASIRIETAGGGNGNTENAASSVGRRWFVPVLPISSLGRSLSAIDPRAQFNENNIHWHTLSKDTLARMFRSVLIASVLTTFVGVTLRPSWGWLPGILLGIVGWFYARKKSKSKRYSRTDWGLIFRSGTWNQKCSMTFFEKIQSVSYSQSPFDRRWHMANLAIDTAAAGQPTTASKLVTSTPHSQPLNSRKSNKPYRHIVADTLWLSEALAQNNTSPLTYCRGIRENPVFN